MNNIDELTIDKLHEMYKNKRVSVKEVVLEYLNRIDHYDQGPGKLNAILELNPDAVKIAEGMKLDKLDSENSLFGVPILLKDNMDTKDGMHTSAGSLALADSFAKEDAVIVKKLRDKGAVILGKTNMTELSNYTSKDMTPGYSSRGGIVYSPYVKVQNPSGSSTGSAVAVAANLCMAAMGTDTSGSVVEPGKVNGIVGFRPSIHALSQKGIIPISFTLDTAGPLTRTVKDTIVLYSALHDTVTDISNQDISNTIIAVDETSMSALTQEDNKRVSTIIETLKDAKATVKRIKLPQIATDVLERIKLHEFKYSINCYLKRLPDGFPIRSLSDIIHFNDQHKEIALRYGQSMLLNAEMNTTGDMDNKQYKEAIAGRETMKVQIAELLEGVDVCMFFGQNLIFQYVGLPIITIPHGLNNDGMPFGVFLSALRDDTLLKKSHLLEGYIGNRVCPDLTKFL